jgi:hypothetical protein
MNASFASKCSLLSLVALACLGADENRLVPNFDGKSIPDPPRQKEPWTSPQTKLPKFLVSATAALFEQGMADPRGCEYREVEIGDETMVKTRGFVLPERQGEARRFVVSWDGVVYPAVSVGAVADLDKDIRTLAESMKRDRESAAAKNPNGNVRSGGFRGGMWGLPGVDGRSPLKVCVLLRLGRGDLAEVLFAGGTSWTPEVRVRDFTDYHISYLSLAEAWAASVFGRLVTAHRRGDDVIALDAARRLSAFAKAVDIKADAMGFRRSTILLPGETPSYFPFLRQLPELLADHERRAKEPRRGPIPRHGGNPSARIAALIRDLDQIEERPGIGPAAANPGNSPLVQALITEGDPAVEPLLTALETDMRLTRSVSFGGRFTTVETVYLAEFAALEGILQTAEFRDVRNGLRQNDLKGRKELARAIRAYWIKNPTISLTDRWYRTLRDDAAGRGRWLEAARGIVQANDNPGPITAAGPREPTRPRLKGEELRSRRDPSVSELLGRRVSEIAGSGDPSSTPDLNLHAACQLALNLYRWDGNAARPVFRTLMTQCLDGIDLNRMQGWGTNRWRGSFVTQFTLIRAKAGDRAALDEYAAWARKSHPRELELQGIACFAPMWNYPDHPAIAAAARWLFNDPESPWLPQLRAPNRGNFSFFPDPPHGGLYTSPLIRVGGFRDGILAAMANKSEIGTVRRGDPSAILYKTNDGRSGGFRSYKADEDAFKPGVNLAFRVCDYLAWQFSSLDGAPDFELYWPEDRRDRAVEACAAFLKRYGERFTPNVPPGEIDIPRKNGHLAFPMLRRPATFVDVREARAIFSLEGQGEREVRMAKVPQLPITARWITLKDYPVEYPNSDGTVRREYDQDGWIWQAEEIRKGDHWERSYGFVGHHVIARVPASEIELSNGRFTDNTWGTLSGGLDARVEPVEPRSGGYEPGRPILMALRIRNRRGAENAAPTEVLRRGADGQPLLRRGVTLAAFYSAPSYSRTPGPGEEIKPKKWSDRFDPGANDPARPLEAFEVFEVMRLDLNDWFDLTRPGSYRVRVTFTADSGVAEGAANPWDFTVDSL